ncbi:hypothetical protein GCM10009554_42710 [Kribbella koreensis]|uniref:Tetratricopeptide repeat protein n=2 Tax=Kribbella TaxID=182639 RepID=A0ABP6VR00_9ACTN
MPNDAEHPPEGDERIARFAGWLRSLHLEAGEPSLSEISKLSVGKFGIHISKASLSEWLTGKRLPPWEKVEHLARFLGGEEGVNECKRRWRIARGEIAEPDRRWPVWIGSKLTRPDSFQPRQVERAALAAAGVTGRAAIVSGFPGTGKTHLAAAYAAELMPHDAADSSKCMVDLTVWAPAGKRVDIVTAYAAAAAQVGIGDPADPDETAHKFLDWLDITDARWLVVLDNVTDAKAVAGLWPVPRPGTGQVIGTTSRTDSTLFEGRDKVLLEAFTDDQANTYLNEALNPSLSDDPASVATALQRLPLALAHAVAFMNDRHLRCASYRDLFDKRKHSLQDLFPDEAELFGREALLTVAATMSLAIDRANQAKPAGVAGALLELGCLLDPNGIPLDAFHTLPAHAYIAGRTDLEIDDVTALVVTSALANLDRFSIATRDAHAIRIHALVQHAAHDLLLGIPTLADSATIIAAEMLIAVWPDVERDRYQAQLLRANTTTLASTLHERVLWGHGSGAHPVLFRAARSLGRAGLLADAIEAYRALHVRALERLGPDHLETLGIRGNLAYWRGVAGDAAGAAIASEALFKDRLRVLGPDHPDTLKSRSSLAHWRAEAGNPAGAAAGFAALKNDHLQVLGPDHPDTLVTRNNLAVSRGMAGDPAGAAAELESLLDDRLRVSGSDHPETLRTRSNLADWRRLAGDPAGALVEFAALLTDLERVLGAENPYTLDTRGRLASSRGEAGDLNGAAEAFKALLADQLRIVGPDHPDTLSIRNNIAHWLGRAGDPAKAAVLSEAVLKDRLRLLGPEHPDTLQSRSNLAAWRGEAGDPAGAIVEFDDLLADQIRILGPDHPGTFNSRSNRASWQGQAGDPAGAAARFDELLADELRVLGPDHPETLATRGNHAGWSGQAGDLAGAKAGYEKLLADRLRILGPDHPDTLLTRENLAYWRQQSLRDR